MRDLGFDEIVGWSFTDPGETARLRIPDEDPRAQSRSSLSNPLSEEQSVMRTTLLGSLLDVAQRNLARGADARRALRVRPRLPAPRRRRADDGYRRFSASARWRAVRRRAAPRRFTSRTGSAASRSARWSPQSWRGRRRARRLLRPQGGARSARRPARRRARLRAGERAVPAPGPLGAGSAPAGSAAGWIGELHPLVCREWDLEAAVAFEVELAALIAAATAGEETFEDVTTFPAVYQDLAVVVRRRGRRGARCARRSSPAAASCCARPRSSTSTRASSSARGARASPCGSSSAPPDRTLTDEEVAALRGDDRGRAGEDRRVAPCAELQPTTTRRRARRAGAGRRRLRLHRRARRADRLAPPASWSWSRSPRAATPARGSTGSTRATGCRWS